MIGQMTGVRFEHRPASALPVTPFTHLTGFAPVDDDYYYEMVAIRAFEKYGIALTVEELGQQWLANNAGSWGLSEQALLLLKRGVKPPDTGHPRYNKLWWTIGHHSSAAMFTARWRQACRMSPGRWPDGSAILTATPKEQMELFSWPA